MTKGALDAGIKVGTTTGLNSKENTMPMIQTGTIRIRGPSLWADNMHLVVQGGDKTIQEMIMSDNYFHYQNKSYICFVPLGMQ